MSIGRKVTARTPETGQVLNNAQASPEIGEYVREWPSSYIYVEAPRRNRRYFTSTLDATKYINTLEGTDELEESWLSFLITNQIPKHKNYLVGLELRINVDGGRE